MKMNNKSGWIMAAIGLAVGLVIGSHSIHPPANSAETQSGKKTAEAKPAEADPRAHRAVDVNLWLQTSGEFRACCLQAYHLASSRLKEKLKGFKKETLPPGVVMDLDETVMDNSPFQTWLYENRKSFTDEQWQIWERDHPKDVLPVPGAIEFIRDAEKQGVMVIYISNRTEKYAKETIESLKHLDINTNDIEKRLLLMKDKISNKEPRREQARKMAQVLLWIGDNLRDFSESFKADVVKGNDIDARRAAIAKRKATVDKESKRFGDDWIIIPNPSYGEWQKLESSNPLDVLNRTKMKGL
jgi:acid phosphatase